MKNLKILFFGKLKDTWNSRSLDFKSNADNIETLYKELLGLATETPHKPSIKVAINDEFAHWNAHIIDGDTIAFLPPASGG